MGRITGLARTTAPDQLQLDNKEAQEKPKSTWTLHGASSQYKL